MKYPVHLGMARSQVANRSGPPDIEGSCEYVEYADNREGVALQLGFGRADITHLRSKKCYKDPLAWTDSLD
jgi:hypothetical protein